MNRLLLILLLPLTAAAQTITYHDAQRLAQQNYPLIQRYDLINQTQDLNLHNIAKGWLPQISADAQATYQSDLTQMSRAIANLQQSIGVNMNGLHKDQYKIALTINQQVYDGGDIAARRNVSQAQTQVQLAQNDVDLYALRQRIDDIFFSILLTDEYLALNHEKQTILQSNEDKLLKLINGGLATQADANEVKAERLEAIQQQVQLNNSRQALLHVLSLFLGTNVTHVTRPDTPQTIPATAQARPENTLFDRQLQLTQAQEQALNTALLPRIDIFASGYYGYPGYNMFQDMMSHKFSLNGIIGAKVSWNISALYTNKNDKRKLKLQRQDIETARQTFIFNTRLQAAQESQTISGYRDLLRNDDEIITLRQTVRKAAEAKLNNGIVDVNNLLQEITRENQAVINRSTHLVELLQHQYSLLNINGQ